MKISISARVELAGYDTLGELYNAGFRHFDHSMPFPKAGSLPEDERQKTIDALIDYSGQRAQELNVDYLIAHAPYVFNPCDSAEDFQLQVKEVKRAIRACGQLHIDRLTVHAGYGNKNPDRATMLKRNVAYYSELLPEAEKYGVMLLIENISENIYKQIHVIETAENILELKKMLGDHPLIDACWDTGHANTLALDQYANITALGSSLAGVHLQDNFGLHDEHMPLLMGNVNFDEVMQALLHIGYNGPFNLETHLFRGGKEWPNYRRPFTEASGAQHLLFDPDHELIVYGYGIMYHMAEYVLNKYGIPIE